MTDPAMLNSKRVIYVGGLSDEVTIPVLRACMIPFGPIHSIDMVRPVLSCFVYWPTDDGKVVMQFIGYGCHEEEEGASIIIVFLLMNHFLFLNK